MVRKLCRASMSPDEDTRSYSCRRSRKGDSPMSRPWISVKPRNASLRCCSYVSVADL